MHIPYIQNNEQIFKHKSILIFILEARGHKSVIDYFITNVKTLKVIQDIKVYKSIGLDSDHYLLCPKVNFPPQGLNKNPKFSVKREEIFKNKAFQRRKQKMAVHTKTEFSLKRYKNKRN